MRKILSFFAAMLIAIVANAAVIEIDNTTPDALRLALNGASDGDEIVMAAGTYVESNGDYIAFDDKAVTVKAAEGAEVIIQPQVPITVSNGGHAIFENVKIDASRLTELADWYEHLLYVADENPNGITFRGCELYGFNLNKSMFYCNNANKVASMKFEDCYFHDIQKSIIFIENTAGKPMVSVKNCTFENIIASVTDSYWAGIIDVRATEATLQVDHCTFYNVIPMNTDYSAVSKITLAKGKVSNCIFMLPTAQDGIRAMRGVTATNCITFNYLKDSGTGIHSSVTQTNCVQVDPAFVDPDNGNFTLSATSPALTMNDGEPIGDPRWVPAASTPVVEYYLVSNMRGWDPDDANKFEPNPGVDGEFVLSTFLYLNEEVKGVKVVDGVVAEWIPAGDNLKIDHAHAGDVDIYFRPEGNLSWPWFFVWIDVTDPLFPDGFYLISEDWTMNGLIGKFDENPSTPGEYMFGAWTVEGSKLKVVYVENFAIKDWYPAGTENEYVVDAAHAGAVTVYFNPTYNSEWSEFGGFMYIPGSVVPLTAPDDAPGAPELEPYQVRAVYSDTYGADCNFGEWGSGTAYSQEAFGKKFVTSGLGYFGLEFSSLDCSEMESLHMDLWIADDASIRVVPIWGGAEQGLYVSLSGQQWNSVEIPLNAFDMITDWSNVYQIKIDDAADLTFWLNNVYFYTTQTKTLDLEDGYYLIGLNGWDEYSLSAADKLEMNPGDPAEYMVFTNLAIGDEFKIVAVESNAITTWFPDGAKPNYVVDYAHAGDITVYFRPDYSGASDWHEACIYVPKNADACPFTTWFAIGDSWTEEFDSYLDWDPVNHVAAVHINIDKYGQWRAQVKYQGPAAEEGKCYRLSLKMKANNNLDNVTVKYQDNAEMIYNPGISLLAGEEFVFDETAAGVAGGNGILVLDFGFAKTGDIIEIYDVVLEEVECPSPEIDINISKGVELYDMIANYGLWQIYANDADYELSLVAYSSALEGTITEADLYEDASYVYLYDIAAEALIEIATLDMTVTANADGSVDFVGKMLGGDGKLYNLNIHYGAVVEVTREIAISEYELMDYRPYSMGWVVVGENAEEGIDIQLIINSEADSPDGDYTLADLNTDYYIIKETVGEEESYPAVFSADIHIETTAAGRIITADLLCTNNVLYKVTLYKAPETISREYFAENIETWEDNTAEAAGWQLVVMDEEYAFSFQTVEGVDRVDGTFNFGVELDDYYSYIVTLPSYNFYDFTELIGVGVQNADKSIDFTFNGKGTDLNTYNIIVHVPAPTPTAIENSNVENENVKTIENGQLRIRHNGKIFNANGARIK